MKFLLFAASLRKDSVNKKLIQLTAKLLQDAGHTVDLAEFSEFTAPLYDGDIQTEKGIPENITQFATRMKQADALIISSPEYNFTMPGTLKNFIDWVSRITPMPWRNQSILLMSASPSLVGGNRGLWNTRIPLECCGAHVYPDMFSLADAYNAFNQNGQLNNEKLQQLLTSMLTEFASYLGK